ncbi:hypothetical protein BC834DRAFT_517507 [Gloeopeniophorella convolvens]|nr:hypothetical protein BC834DRAFT_517507 [Gloeopeniophorella convolvens]
MVPCYCAYSHSRIVTDMILWRRPRFADCCSAWTLPSRPLGQGHSWHWTGSIRTSSQQHESSPIAAMVLVRRYQDRRRPGANPASAQSILARGLLQVSVRCLYMSSILSLLARHWPLRLQIIECQICQLERRGATQPVCDVRCPDAALFNA